MFGNPVRGPRIVPFGAPRLASDVLLNGHPAFRVTQRFDDLDAYWQAHGEIRRHNALDLGNFYCGDDVLAPKAGTVTVRKDPYGAIGIHIDHGDGWATESWHLSDARVSTGQKVERGQVVGHIGGTGLAMGVCHDHFMVLRNGTPVDPWPLLDQNAPAAIKDHAKLNATDGINIRLAQGQIGGGLRPVWAEARNGKIIRLSDGKVLQSASERLQFHGYENGARHGIEPYPAEWAMVRPNANYRWHAVARPLMTRVD